MTAQAPCTLLARNAPLWMMRACWVALVCLQPLSAARAHELDYQSLQLIWSDAEERLRAQVVTDPELVRGQGDARAEALVRLLRESLRIEVDGVDCPLRFELRELWVRAGATAGDVVMVQCPAFERAPGSLRVFVGDALHGLRVTVQRVARSGELSTDTVLATGDAWSEPFSLRAALSGWTLVWKYLRYGVEHILDEGWDHVAFVATLVLGALGAGFTALLLRLSAFTLAHSITLALGALGWVVLPRALVEALIAVSIALLALVQLLGLVRNRWQLVLPFAFGLLHGQGFASVLIGAGLPLSGFLLALLAFNLGVELGQALWASAFWLGARALPAELAPRVHRLCACALLLLGLYWTWERTLGGTA